MPRLVRILIALLPMVLATGCGVVSGDSPEAIYRADSFEIYPDSMVIDGTDYNALGDTEITHAWKADTTVAGLPSVSSSSRMADAFFHKSMLDVSRDGFTPDATDIYLLAPLLDAGLCMDALRQSAQSGEDIASTDWASAAWELYCATGSTDWLREAYQTILASLSHDNYRGALSCGIPDYMLPQPDFFPDWMTTVDLMQVKSLGVNTRRFRSLSVAADMAALLGEGDDETLRDTAASLRSTINDTFWDPAVNRYCEYLYGSMFPILSQAADNYGAALCMLFDVATDEMAAANIASTFTLPRGVPVTFPSLSPSSALIPRVQALHGLAAAKAHDSSSLRQAIGSLWPLILKTETDPAAWPALLLKGLFGISLSPDGIRVRPFVPSIFSGTLTLSGLRYRDAVLDITVNGTGDRIASASLDGSPTMEAFIPAGLEGRHTLTITLSGNTLREREPDIARDVSAPPVPKVLWNTPRTATILNHDPGTGYDIYINGVMTESIDGSTYAVSGAGTQVIDIVPVAKGTPPMPGFSPRSHVSASPADVISIPATSITPRRPPRQLAPYKDIAGRYIELAARHNTRLTFYVNASSPGLYFLNILYSNGSDETAVRSVEVNSKDAGTISFPPVKPNDWVTTGTSTTITVPLTVGPNKLSLYYVNSTILLNEIRLLKQ